MLSSIGNEADDDVTNDATDGATDYVAIVITSQLVNDVLLTSLMTLVWHHYL